MEYETRELTPEEMDEEARNLLEANPGYYVMARRVKGEATWFLDYELIGK